MKKFLLMGLLTLVVLTSCDKYKEARQFAADFAAAVENSDKKLVEQMYPDAVNADSLFLSFNVDSLIVEESEGGLLLKFGKDKIATLKTTEDGIMKIVNSKGLFAYPAEKLNFAISTGWYDTSLTDKENAIRLADTMFVLDLKAKAKEKVIAMLNEKVKIIKSETEAQGMEKEKCIVVVSNETSREIAADEYSIKATFVGFFRMMGQGYWEPYESKTLSGKAIPANGTVEYTYDSDWHGSYQPDRITSKLSFTPNLDNIFSDYKATGKEYQEYLANKE